MSKNEIDARLGWSLRTGNGFYYKGKRYSGIAYHEDCIDIHTDDVNSIVYINYENIVDIKNVRIDGKLHKTIITKDEI